MNDFDELFFKRSVLGAKLEEKLSELGYTKTHFSKACGISRPTLDKILTGNISSKTNYEKHLAKVFGCLSITPEELLGNVKEPYSRTREIRTILSVKEDEIALSTSLSVDRLHAIEAGDSASLAELRDIAAYLGTSTKCIANTNIFYTQVATPELFLDIYHDNKSGALSGFWGHIGIQPTSDDSFLWYPITQACHKTVLERIENNRIVIPCMNNKLLYVNTQNINNIVFLEESCDPPSFANWDSTVSCGEIPLVVYEALEDYFYYSSPEKKPPADLISSVFWEYMTKLIADKQWTEDNISLLTQKICVRYKNRSTLETYVDFYLDSSLVDEVGLIYNHGMSPWDNKFLSFADYSGAVSNINTDNITIIELPLIKVEEKLYSDLEEMMAE